MSSLTLEKLKCHVLAPVDLVVKAGECVCLSGPSGIGKSLLLRAIVDLDPHEGQVFVNGDESKTVDAAVWRRRVAMLPSESQWWGEQVGEHFNGVDTELLARLGFEEPVMQWQVSRLSSGERQRLALIRLLSRKSEVLLLDEPTANLDPDSAREAEAIIGEYCRQHEAAVLWVSHDPQQIKRVADRHLRIEDDQLVEVTLS